MRRLLFLASLSIGSLACVNCGPPAPKGCNSLNDAGAPDFQCAGVAAVSLTTLETQLLGTTTCALSGCHVAGGLGPTNYTTAMTTFTTAVGKPSVYGNGMMFVDPGPGGGAPGNLTNSTMWLKVLGGSPSYSGPAPLCAGVGPMMPQGATMELPLASRNLIKGWICAGAPNN